MYTHVHPDFLLVELRERHARLRREAEASHAFRAARGKHRFRSRHRPPRRR